MCELEVRLNQRLSRGVYLGVVPLSAAGEEIVFGDGGRVVEYAVKMKRLPDDASLSSLIASGKVTLEEMVRLGGRLADFYAAAERSDRIDRYGGRRIIELNTEENFRQLTPFVGNLLEKERFDFVMESSRGFFRDRGALFKRRIREGRICDGHGDLRAEHIYFIGGLQRRPPTRASPSLREIQVIDCIEFNERFRYGDAASDLAFLHMDVERLGRPDLSQAILNGYIESSLDYGVWTLLDFYSCYRAIVKLKISCLSAARLEEGPRKREMRSRAARYLDLAFRYAVQFARPTLYVLCGLPGTGKSTYAKKLRDIFNISFFRSDEARKELPEYNAHHGPVPFGTGIYRPDMRGLVYSRLLSAIQQELKKGRSAILDATFSMRKWRKEAVRLAEDLDVNILFLECMCSQETVLERLGRRSESRGGLSDARSEHLPRFIDEFETIDELSPERHTVINTEAEIEPNLRTILSRAYSKKRAQVERVIERL
jgi:hypothetical protein